MPSSPYRSPFPASNPSKVWDVLVDALRRDPVLKSAVDTWQVLDGSEADLLEPSDEDMPLLRLEPTAGQGMWLDESSHQYTIPIRFTLGVASTDVRILWDFWDALRAALFTGNAVLHAMYAFSVVQKTISTPVAQARRWGDNAGLSGTGTITIKMRVDS
jgi:hypothetical protein